MRLGGPLFQTHTDPAGWVAALQAKGYRAAYCPVKPGASAAEVAAYRQAAAAANIVIAEVGAWSNPISSDPAERRAALDKCKAGLQLADEIGAACCVNIAGSAGSRWDGPHPDNLTGATFARIVDSVREIIDAVNPVRTFYALETMPWIFPDSVASYDRLVRAIDRPRFAVHFDPVNLINCPERYFHNPALIREFVAKLGPHIRSCHIKDIALGQKLTVHLDEVRPGLGALDYQTLLRELRGLEPDLPIMLEHLPSAEEYDLAAQHVRAVAAQEGIDL